ncbi:MAG TPA: response regulator [Patescibacteria group bacterium]|nr:response regulator [Patescibacteria group bacterium]
MTEKQKILIVEDDNFLMGMYCSKLELEGFKVASASDGDKALRLVKKELPDIILLDLMLPKKDGFEVLAELKKDERTKGIPVIILTNLGQKEDIDKCFKLGAEDYLIKAHFIPSEVIAKIKKALEKF